MSDENKVEKSSRKAKEEALLRIENTFKKTKKNVKSLEEAKEVLIAEKFSNPGFELFNSKSNLNEIADGGKTSALEDNVRQSLAKASNFEGKDFSNLGDSRGINNLGSENIESFSNFIVSININKPVSENIVDFPLSPIVEVSESILSLEFENLSFSSESDTFNSAESFTMAIPYEKLIKPITQFSGNVEDLNRFIFSIELAARNLHETQREDELIPYLYNKIPACIFNYISSLKVATIKDFKLAISEKFARTSSIEDLRFEIANSKQKKGESVANYVDRLELLASTFRQLYASQNEEMNAVQLERDMDAMLKRSFLAGILNPLRSMASNRDFSSYKDARKFAKEKEFAAELCMEEQNYQDSDFISNGENSQYLRKFQTGFNRQRNVNYNDRDFNFSQRNFDYPPRNFNFNARNEDMRHRNLNDGQYQKFRRQSNFDNNRYYENRFSQDEDLSDRRGVQQENRAEYQNVRFSEDSDQMNKPSTTHDTFPNRPRTPV